MFERRLRIRALVVMSLSVALSAGCGGDSTTPPPADANWFADAGDAAPPADATPDAVSCDGVDCSAMTDSCNTGTCNAETGLCEAVPMMDGTMCDDGDACTSEDACGGGSCAGTALDCSAMTDMCNVGMCNAADGTCVAMPMADDTMCDDSSLCTSDDVCTAGVCAGAGMDCSAMDDMCNAGTCNEMSGACEPAPVMDGTLCDDADACTGLDSCMAGACGGIGVDCSGMTDMCNVGTCDAMDGSCGATPVADDTMCDDRTSSTVGDVCTGGTCAGVRPASCRALNAASPALRDGRYIIYPGGVATVVYCDMTTDGGGWTLTYKIRNNIDRRATDWFGMVMPGSGSTVPRDLSVPRGGFEGPTLAVRATLYSRSLATEYRATTIRSGTIIFDAKSNNMETTTCGGGSGGGQAMRCFATGTCSCTGQGCTPGRNATILVNTVGTGPAPSATLHTQCDIGWTGCASCSDWSEVGTRLGSGARYVGDSVIALTDTTTFYWIR